jgi:hypothetical protein
MEIPQEVRSKTHKATEHRFSDRQLDEIIEAAQLPIAPFGADEVEAVWRRGCEYSDSKYLVLDIANRVISRRNSQVDPLVEKIEELLCDAPLCSKPQPAAIHEVAKKIAAAVRQEHP